MVMKNGKIVGLKKKKLEAVLDNPKPKKPKTELKVKDKKPKAEKSKPEKSKPEKSKAKTRKETSEPESGYLKLGEHGYLTVALTEDDGGNKVVAFRKFYTTKNDSEKKPARGGFNMQASSAELKILATQLRQFAKEIDGE